MGAVLAYARGIAAGWAGIAAGYWRLDLYSYDLAGPEIFGRTCGLVGFGGVGPPLPRSPAGSACGSWCTIPTSMPPSWTRSGLKRPRWTK